METHYLHHKQAVEQQHEPQNTATVVSAALISIDQESLICDLQVKTMDTYYDGLQPDSPVMFFCCLTVLIKLHLLLASLIKGFLFISELIDFN